MDTTYIHVLFSIAERYPDTLWSAATAETLSSLFCGPIRSLDELEAFSGVLCEAGIGFEKAKRVERGGGKAS